MNKRQRFKKATIEIAFEPMVLGALIGFISGQIIQGALISINAPHVYLFNWASSGFWLYVCLKSSRADRRSRKQDAEKRM